MKTNLCFFQLLNPYNRKDGCMAEAEARPSLFSADLNFCFRFSIFQSFFSGSLAQLPPWNFCGEPVHSAGELYFLPFASQVLKMENCSKFALKIRKVRFTKTIQIIETAKIIEIKRLQTCSWVWWCDQGACVRF